MAKKKEYKNGAILIYKRKKIKCTTVAAGFIFGKNRNNYSEPIAHFCEHMLLSETQLSNKKELSQKIDDTFSHINALTYMYKLCIDFARSNKALEKCFALSSEMLLQTKFSSKNIEIEKGVIKQEYITQKDNPKHLFFCANKRTLQNNNTENTSIIGSAEEIDKITKKDLEKFHREIFISQNFIISIVGNISFRRAKFLAKKHFISKLKSNPYFQSDKTEYLPIERPGNLNIEPYKISKVMCKVIFKIDEKYENNFSKACLTLLSNLLNNNSINLYTGQLRNKGLAYNAYFDYSTVKERTLASFYFECSKENINKILNAIAKTIKILKEDEISTKIIDNIKKKIKLSADETGTIAYPSATNFLNSFCLKGDEIISEKHKKQNRKQFFKLTAKDIKKFSNEIFSHPENLYVTCFGNVSTDDIYSYKKMQTMFTKN